MSHNNPEEAKQHEIQPRSATQPTTRLHEIITRIGEICLSPELAHVMLFPTHAMSYALNLTTPLDFPEAYHELCRDPSSILCAMSDIPSAQLSPEHSAKFLAKFTESCLPPPTVVTYRQPIHLCAWRIESPSRVLVYTGQSPAVSPDMAQFTPHTLSKILLDERSKRPSPSSIHLLSNDQELTPNAIRQSLLHYAQTALTPHRERISILQKKQETSHNSRNAQFSSRSAPGPRSMTQQYITVLDHTLEEAAAVFTHPPSRNHSEIGLNQSPPWDKDHIDSRQILHTLFYRLSHPLDLCIITYIWKFLTYPYTPKVSENFLPKIEHPKIEQEFRVGE